MQLGLSALSRRLNGASAAAGSDASHTAEDGLAVAPMGALQVAHLAVQSGVTPDVMLRRLEMAALSIKAPDGAVVKKVADAAAMDADEIASRARALMDEKQADGSFLNAAQAVGLVMQQNKA